MVLQNLADFEIRTAHNGEALLHSWRVSRSPDSISTKDLMAQTNQMPNSTIPRWLG